MDKDILNLVLVIGSILFVIIYAWLDNKYSNQQIGYGVTLIILTAIAVIIMYILAYFVIRAFAQ